MEIYEIAIMWPYWSYKNGYFLWLNLLKRNWAFITKLVNLGKLVKFQVNKLANSLDMHIQICCIMSFHFSLNTWKLAKSGTKRKSLRQDRFLFVHLRWENWDPEALNYLILHYQVTQHTHRLQGLGHGHIAERRGGGGGGVALFSRPWKDASNIA